MFRAIFKSLKSLFDIKVLFLMMIPFLMASFCLILLLFLFWTPWTDFLVATEAFKWLMESIGDNFFLTSLKFLILGLATLFVFGPMWYLICVFLISVLLLPMLLPHLQKRYYPGLEKKFGGSIFGSFKNVIITTFIYLLFLGLTLLFWIFTPLGPVVSLLATAYLNKNIFMYDVLQDYASEEERLEFKKNHMNESWFLGLGTTLIAWVPVINFIAPSFTALAFIHFYLGSLQKNRQKLSN